MDVNDIRLEDETKETTKKLPSVNFKDVEKIGYEIALNFKAKKLPIEEVEKGLFTEPMKTNGYSTIAELQAILAQFVHFVWLVMFLDRLSVFKNLKRFSWLVGILWRIMMITMSSLILTPNKTTR